jgi:hypothetical protein
MGALSKGCCAYDQKTKKIEKTEIDIINFYLLATWTLNFDSELFAKNHRGKN